MTKIANANNFRTYLTKFPFLLLVLLVFLG